MEQSCSTSRAPPEFRYDSFPPGLPVPFYPPEPANRSYRMRKRNPAQVYHCVQCNKNIKYPSKITEHIRKHTGEKPHICTLCNASFAQAHTLKSHMEQHIHEKPYKCSFCPAEFLDHCDRKEHERHHMHNGDECIEDGSYMEIDPLTLVPETYYQCPLSCGFESYEEQVVAEHIAAEHSTYRTVCWEMPNEPPVVGTGLKVENIPVENGLIEANYTEETDQIYEFFEEQYVPQVASEAIIDVTEEETFGAHYEPEEQGEGSSRVVIYEDEAEEEKELIITEEEKTEEIPIPTIYEDMIMDEDELEEEDQIELGSDVVVVDEDEEDEEKVRVIVNPNPPKRGTKSARDHHEASEALREMVVDASVIELAAPTRHMKQAYQGVQKRKRGKKAENLDWIIDAVAKGVDVNEASPHHRKKPTLHKCEYCGKVDKYPSKIRAHMRTHTGEKPYKCEICGMAFSQRTPMRLHLRRHFDQKPYECEVEGCGERFVSGAILKMHIEKKHMNKKKYVCIRGCGRVFSSAFNQRQHEKKCSQSTYLTWVEGPESGEESAGEYHEEVYVNPMMHQLPSTSRQQQHEPAGIYHDEGPVFLHQ